jgi:hypothetical protein
MKITVFILGFAFLTGFSGAETIQKSGDVYKLAFTSADASRAHMSANVFVREVGNALKASYPSKVLDPNVNLTVLTKNGRKLFYLVWSCRIVRASINEADYYFDRRGTLLGGATPKIAKLGVEAEIATSRKVQAMRKSFRNSRIPESFIRNSSSGSRAEGYWHIKEYFLVAPR